VTDDTDVVGRRIAAALIDLVVVFGLFLVLGFTIGESETSDASFSVELGGPATIVWIVLGLLYYFGTEAAWGRTLGKLILGLRVLRLDGGRAGGRPVAIRTAMRAIDVLPFLYLVGFVVLMSTGKGHQRLGDMAAGTLVARG
jgi:uncharacterized RDD family membrane protein YckC